MSPVSFSDFGLWVACAAVVFGLYVQWRTLKASETNKTREIGPQPLMVKPEDSVVTKSVLEQTQKENNRRFVALEEQAQAAAAASAESRRRIYDKIEQVKTELSTQTDSVRRELGGKIDDTPERVIAILRNTKAI